jgi:hypothetical protein
MARTTSALIAGVVMAGSLLAAAPAVASPASTASIDQCAVNRFCVWTGPGATGLFASFTSGAPELPVGIDNNVASVFNRTKVPWCLYDGRNYRGLLAEVAPNTFGNLLPSMSNQVSSLRPC